MKALTTLVFAIGLLFTQIASAQWDPEGRRKLEEEVQLNEARARDLQPIIARNSQARNDMNADAQILAQQAQDMRNRANWYRQAAARPGVWHREHLEQHARELDQYAHRNDELASSERSIAQTIEGMIRNLEATRNWHIEVARRMRESLAWQH